MKIMEVTQKRTPASVPQGMATRKLYGTESAIIEKIWDMKRPRSLKTLQVAMKVLWDHYAPKYKVRWKMPELRFGPGTKYHGRYLSYTYGMEYIELAPGERNFYVLIHELVHALGAVQHGVRFAEIYHDLLTHETMRELMDNELGAKFLNFLKNEHPQYVRRAYRNR
jgi:hypothetical protein